jgi:HEPN domain-containing protein
MTYDTKLFFSQSQMELPLSSLLVYTVHRNRLRTHRILKLLEQEKPVCSFESQAKTVTWAIWRCKITKNRLCS